MQQEVLQGGKATTRKVQLDLRAPGNDSLLTLEVCDAVIAIIRRTEVLARLMEAASEPRFELDSETQSETAHMIADEMEDLRRVLQISRPMASGG